MQNVPPWREKMQNKTNLNELNALLEGVRGS